MILSVCLIALPAKVISGGGGKIKILVKVIKIIVHIIVLRGSSSLELGRQP